MFSIGQRVMVNMAGFSHGGVSFGGGVDAAGVVTAINPDGSYGVRLSISIGGASDVAVGQGRLRAA